MSRLPIRPRTPLRLVLAVALAATLGNAAGQPAGPASAAPGQADATAADAPRAHATGDAWLDGRLAAIDAYAIRHPDAFGAELERYAGVPQAYVHGLLAQPGWGGGDAWFACFLARATEATCRSVVRARTQAGVGAGWEEVAAGFDAAPGSAAYRNVRLALADSFRRWALPLQPDAALSRALRERAAGDPGSR
ncbi:hypothetical protein [Pseudoxanthomonas koreensis]|uniref:hypothetical protein n=1 Tax=Pseudoxanthomonas koreensis TaxID=266061 RepID=UPI001391DF23|nr:hypothetical protein [Pseudoxanthomonas koreensis]KAF1694597.1 hypothetical protein CSC64_04075 [Pseudoxanthomonas koreensis]